jgi:hypothetical protein
MPDLPHLPLRRVEYEAPRKKRAGFGGSTTRNFREHGGVLRSQVTEAIQQIIRQPRPASIDPALILRVRLSANVDDDAWRNAGLTLVGKDGSRVLVLFASDTELTEFRRRLDAYQSGPGPDQKNAPYTPLFANIDGVGRIQPLDRIGRLLKLERIERPEDFADGTTYTVDLELWHTGDIQDCRKRLDQVSAFITSGGGRVTDIYVGASLVLARVKAGGGTIRTLLTLDSVASLDLPPRVSIRVSQQLNTGLQNLGPIFAPPGDAQGICVLDSGVTAGHPLLAPAMGETTAVPPRLGTAADVNGHGTGVAGIALYGDIQECIDSGTFVPLLRLFSARVLNQNNEFDDETLITTQMRQGIEYFKNTYGCRVFNASLGDDRMPFNGGKVSAWASILDDLARELNIVIVVSAGNYDHEPSADATPDDHIQGYPRYLLESPAKIIEPATGCIVLSVGSIVNSANLPLGTQGRVALRPIAQPGQPSPFTRSGPGIQGAIKPELCETGGNSAYDGAIGRLQTNLVELSVVSLNRDYLQRLFSTDIGTSYASAKVAHSAARICSQFPDASANLVRALLAASAEVPPESRELLESISDNAVLQLCGYGLPSLPRAMFSDSNRAILYAENELPFDRFHIYEVPIVEEFCVVDGEREIAVALAFDPPVRHSRLDYLGTTMSFRLIRGKTVEDVAAAFKQQDSTQPKVQSISVPYDCSMSPGPTTREGSTLQKAAFVMKKKPRDYGETYFLVVRCHQKWAPHELSPQRYAVVVTIQHRAEVDLYARIQARLQQPVRLRATV